jgi:hypothetical protein
MKYIEAISLAEQFERLRRAMVSLQTLRSRPFQVQRASTIVLEQKLRN